MRRFTGLTVKPFSQVTDMKPVKIDRVRVEVRRTLFGEIEYDIIGSYGPEGMGWPVCRPLDKLDDVWPQKEKIEAAIEAARKEENERVRKSGIPPSEGAV